MNNKSDVEIVTLIRTRLLRRGKGVGGDPIRVIIQYWDFAGNLIFEVDTWNNETKTFNTL
jgi:hypothetical protein